MTSTARRLALSLLLLAGCGGARTHAAHGGGPASGGAMAPRHDLGCTPTSAVQESLCASQGDGCGIGAPLQCYGTPPPPEETAAVQQAYEAATQPCECICDKDRQECSEVP